MDAQPDPPEDLVQANEEYEDDGSETEIDIENEWQIQDRFWIRAILPFVRLAACQSPDSMCPQPSGDVQYAIDRMAIAACKRVTRIMESDLEPKEYDVNGCDVRYRDHISER